MKWIILLALASFSFGLVGCSGSDVQVSKQEEENFRNPPKEIPPESLKKMQEARARAAQQASQRMGGGN